MPIRTDKNNRMDQFRGLLRRYGLKATPQRVAVHEAMLKLGHASADMVTETIAAEGKTKVTVASVYNILSNLALLGVYRYRMSANNKMYFDVNAYRHVHIYDIENHAYKDIVDDDLIALVETHLGGRRFRGYKIEDIDIQLVARPTRKKTVTSAGK